MESRIAHILKEPIQVSVRGDLEDVQVVDLVAPSKKQLKKTYRLQQAVMQAMLSSQKAFKDISSQEAQADTPEGEEQVLDEKTIMAMLLASDVDIEMCFLEFEKLAALGCVEVNGQAINKIQFEKLEAEDAESVFASYLANFILPSVMKTFSSS